MSALIFMNMLRVGVDARDKAVDKNHTKARWRMHNWTLRHYVQQITNCLFHSINQKRSRIYHVTIFEDLHTTSRWNWSTFSFLFRSKFTITSICIRWSIYQREDFQRLLRNMLISNNWFQTHFGDPVSLKTTLSLVGQRNSVSGRAFSQDFGQNRLLKPDIDMNAKSKVHVSAV